MAQQIVSVLLFICFAVAVQCATVTVDWNTPKQRIDGFGASSAWLSGMTDAQATMIFSTSGGAGISLLRTHIGSDPTPDTELDIAKLAHSKGATVWSTPWSPPASYKDNNDVNNGGHLLSQHYTDYANRLVDYVNMMKNQGIPIYAVSTQNEPDMNVNYESCLFDQKSLHDWAQVLGQVFKSKNVGAKVLIGEQSGWSFSLSSEALSDAAVLANIDIVAAHFYSGNPTGPAPYNKTIWETEHFLNGDTDNTMKSGLALAQEMHKFLTVANVNAYHYWHIAPASNATTQAGLCGYGFTKTKRLFVMGQYSKFVRPGWTRIDAQPTTTGSVSVSAYKDSSNNFAIVVFNTASSQQTVTLKLSGSNFASVRTFTPWITDDSRDIVQLSAITFATAGQVDVNVPAMSAVTYVGKV